MISSSGRAERSQRADHKRHGPCQRDRRERRRMARKRRAPGSRRQEKQRAGKQDAEIVSVQVRCEHAGRDEYHGRPPACVRCSP